ncbi:MAG TPA: Npt1/Npt2 family nucleotide transporter [Candidatus Babeliaceae bacterium]|nr:Npt1/Npt2 family nucleotide transporter [Candidatus Babeliaceae bacterium]
MTSNSSQEFGRFRSWFCPVHKNELKIFIPLLLIFFFICFNYNILRPAKDSLVITAPSSGAEIIPFMKVWVILPMALVMTILFTRLANRYSTEKVFYIMMSLFLGFFMLFALVLFPLRDALHPHAFADQMESYLPLGLKGFVALIRNWTYTTFYVMAELWSTTIMSVLFWGLANEILNVKTAKRFYALILFGGNLSAICAGGAVTISSKLASKLALVNGTDPWQYSLLFLSCTVIVAGLIVMGIFRWFHKNILENPVHRQQLTYETKKSDDKMSLRKNFKYLAGSKYLLCIATIVLTYNICINLTEVTWKDQLLHVFPEPNAFNAYMGKVTMWIGIVATMIAVISTITIRKLSWTTNAMIAPVLLLITGVGFFSFLLFKNSMVGIAIAAFLGSTPTMIGILFGSFQQCISRASKYTIFDATKELTFIPLSRESKLKGKAAIDGVGSRLGKSGSAIMYQALLMFCGTVSATIPYVGGILLFVIAAWMVAAYFLGKQFQALVTQNEAAAVKEPASAPPEAERAAN